MYTRRTNTKLASYERQRFGGSGLGDFGRGGSALSMDLEQAQEDCQKASAAHQEAKAASMPAYLIEGALTKARARCKHAASLKEKGDEKEEEEDSFWPGVKDLFTSILPVAGGVLKDEQDRRNQQDLMSLVFGRRETQPTTIVVQGGGSKTGLYIGLGLAGLAVVGGIFMLRGRG